MHADPRKGLERRVQGCVIEHKKACTLFKRGKLLDFK